MRGLVLGAVSAMVLAVPGAVAAAPPTFWGGTPCAVGEMTAVAAPGRNVTVTGWIESCPSVPVEPGATFTVGYYGPVSARTGRLLGYNENEGRDGPTHFARSLDTLRPDYPPRAVCLVFNPISRLSCFGVEVVDGSDLLRVTPIATDDPRVTTYVAVDPQGKSVTNPSCGTCV